MAGTRRAPQRTCIACRETGEKASLVRIVRTPGGRVKLDETGRLPGRGAYLHRSRGCWEEALRGSRINHALRLTPAEDDVAALRTFAEQLPQEETLDP